ncbi:MAG TPA: 5'/3'-nucleotidase SurE [Chitinophagales bacterium]|nr:5'/3'-nucleotidase SurE [Chitinophagales bacterium]
MAKKKITPKSKPTILITNDDGITSPGIRALVEEMTKLGNVIVVAPDSPQSGMGHAITLDSPLRLERVEIFEGVESYECSGTPVDCVKVAVDKIIKGKPDLCVSGINHGSNSSINVIYSGTMSAAMEAAIEGICAIGFSYLNYLHDADMSLPRKVAFEVSKQVLKNGLPKNVLLNVNIPDVSVSGYNGVRVCRQAVAKWEEEFAERVDPRGRKYYWLTGKFVNYDLGDDTDEWALTNGYASVVPVQFDLTAHHAIPYLINNWKLNAENR